MVCTHAESLLLISKILYRVNFFSSHSYNTFLSTPASILPSYLRLGVSEVPFVYHVARPSLHMSILFSSYCSVDPILPYLTSQIILGESDKRTVHQSTGTTCPLSSVYTLIHFVVRLPRTQPLPKRVLRPVWSSASSFSFQYPLFPLRSFSSCIRLPPRLPVNSIIPSILMSLKYLMINCRAQPTSHMCYKITVQLGRHLGCEWKPSARSYFSAPT